MQLNNLRRFEAANRGPGSYEPPCETENPESCKAAFGFNASRKLDTTEPGIVANPGPSDYQREFTTKGNDKNSSVFLAQGKKPILSSDPSFPGPTSYGGSQYTSFGQIPLQGGSPNNVLTLLKAEEKIMKDNMFPFLVQSRMPESKSTLSSSNLGPGLYNIGSFPASLKDKLSNSSLFPYNGSSEARFKDKSSLRNPGPG